MLPMVCNEKKAKADKVSENDCNHNTHIRVRCPVGVSRGLCHSLDAEPFFSFGSDLRAECVHIVVVCSPHRRGGYPQILRHPGIIARFPEEVVSNLAGKTSRGIPNQHPQE